MHINSTGDIVGSQGARECPETIGMAAAAAIVRRGSASSTLAIVLAIAVVTCSSFPPSSSAAAAAKAAPCSSQTFSGEHPYASCADLPRLGATLHYNYTAATNTVAVAFRAPQAKGDDGWVAWGINPSGRTGMVGTQAVVAFQHSNGSLVAYPTVLSSYAPSMAPAAPEDLAFPVSGVAAEYDAAGKEMVVYATVALPAAAGKTKQGSKFTHVWQQGTAVVNDVPAAHPTSGDNILSTATIDFSD